MFPHILYDTRADFDFVVSRAQRLIFLIDYSLHNDYSFYKDRVYSDSLPSFPFKLSCRSYVSFRRSASKLFHGSPSIRPFFNFAGLTFVLFYHDGFFYQPISLKDCSYHQSRIIVSYFHLKIRRSVLSQLVEMSLLSYDFPCPNFLTDPYLI
jgi:hypothetical protein